MNINGEPTRNDKTLNGETSLGDSTADDLTISGDLTVGGTSSFDGQLDMNNAKIINLGTPTNSSDATTKAYVDSVIPVVTGFLKIDGSNAMTASLDAGTNKVINVVDPAAAQDAATKNYVDTNIPSISGLLKIDGSNAMTASLDAGTNKVINVVDPAAAQDAATKNYVDTNIPSISGLLKIDGSNAMTASLDAGTNKITNVTDPTDNQDAATKKYVDDNAGSQWVTTGSDIYYNTGNVGVGLTSVSEKFEVATDTDSVSILGRLKADSFSASTIKYFQIRNNEYTPFGVYPESQLYALKQDNAGRTFINSHDTGTNSTIFFANGDVEIGRFYNGFFGIGNFTTLGSTPEAPIHVVTSENMLPSHAAWFGQTGIGRLFVIPYYVSRSSVANFHSGQSNSHMGIASGSFTTNLPVSIISEQSIWCKWAIVITSDSRIKESIEDVEDAEALNIVNKIPCRKYFYKTRYTEHKTIGFIAQEVREHLPEAVMIKNCVAPDELRHIEPPVWNGNVLTIDDITFNEEHTGLCKFIVSDVENEQGKEIQLKVNDDKKTFTFEKSWNFVFLYGKEVNDFHSLDKNMIFALHHSAIQEVDRQLQAEKTKRKEDSKRILDLNKRLLVLEEKLKNVESNTEKEYIL